MPAGQIKSAPLFAFRIHQMTLQVEQSLVERLSIERIDIRVKSEKPTQALLEQGYQTPTIYTAMVHEGNIEIEHNDQVHITAPAIGFFYNKKFRIIGIQRSSNHPYQDRNQIMLTLRRWEESHSNDLQ